MEVVPAAGVIIISDDGQILLVRRGHQPQMGRWTVPGGRLEPGETHEQAAAREAFEETGLRVRIEREALRVRLPAGEGREFEVRDFIATVTGGALVPGDDAADARWFTPEELDQVELTTNLLGYLRDAGVAPDLRDARVAPADSD